MEKTSAQLIARFSELQNQAQKIPLTGGDTPRASPEQFYAWAASASNAIRAAFGEDSPHFRRFETQLSKITNSNVWPDTLAAIKGTFLGAKSDVDGGHIFSLQRSFSGEIFADFVAAAKVAQAEGHHAVAAVLASAALEDALKRYAASEGLDVDGKTMEEVINALKTKGMVSGAQKSLLSAMPKIRNYAMHADWSKLTPQDTGSVIGYVEQFLLTHFS